MMISPDEPKTRHSHVRRRFSITSSSIEYGSAAGRFGSICTESPGRYPPGDPDGQRAEACRPVKGRRLGTAPRQTALLRECWE
jgi:hypothetical protein